MNVEKLRASAFVLLMICLSTVEVSAGRGTSSVQAESGQSYPIELITAEELKTKMARNETVTVIDVRATKAYVDSETRIKGALHFKLRRLKSRLAFPPLKDLPRDREIVTYCACPTEETGMRAARILSAAGFRHVRVLKGGWQAWMKVNGQFEKRPGNL